MAHIYHNNFNFINFNNLPIINNELQNEFNIEWVIDRRPDMNIINDLNNTIINFNNNNNYINYINNIQLIRNDNNEQLDLVPINELILNNFNEELDDFIPFEPQSPQAAIIATQVAEISVSEEERDCPICFETREYQDISQINCGHKFCGNCITQHVRTQRREPHCPLCRGNIEYITFQTHGYNVAFLEI